MTNKKTGEVMHLPCGRCYPCTMRRVSGWSFRLVQEDKRAYSSSFLTLTYNTKHVPLSKKGFMTLRKTDLQSFFKRLRYYEKEYRYRTDSKTIRLLSIMLLVNTAVVLAVLITILFYSMPQSKLLKRHGVTMTSQSEKYIMDTFPKHP